MERKSFSVPQLPSVSLFSYFLPILSLVLFIYMTELGLHCGAWALGCGMPQPLTHMP